jgi:hypothetical protein
MSGDPYAALVGSPSDEVPAILATGRGEITSLYVSISARHAEGKDAEYLAWHTLDHRPEQYRLSAIRAALRLVSTPACRAARAASEPPFDAVDHVMIYFFSDLGGLKGFEDLAKALRESGRMPYALPSVQPGIFRVEERVAHPKIKAGADVLPWWPAKGAYLLIEDGAAASLQELMDVPGVVGGWQALGQPGPYSKAGPTQRTSLLFLDDEPVSTAARLRPALAERWRTDDVRPLLAAPLQILVPHKWDQYLPA